MGMSTCGQDPIEASATTAKAFRRSPSDAWRAAKVCCWSRSLPGNHQPLHLNGPVMLGNFLGSEPMAGGNWEAGSVAPEQGMLFSEPGAAGRGRDNEVLGDLRTDLEDSESVISPISRPYRPYRPYSVWDSLWGKRSSSQMSWGFLRARGVSS